MYYEVPNKFTLYAVLPILHTLASLYTANVYSIHNLTKRRISLKAWGWANGHCTLNYVTSWRVLKVESFDKNMCTPYRYLFSFTYIKFNLLMNSLILDNLKWLFSSNIYRSICFHTVFSDVYIRIHTPMMWLHT